MKPGTNRLVASTIEREREERTRTVRCPSCGRRSKRGCLGTQMSHTIRYNVAAAQGLVPALRPVPTEAS